MELEDARGKQNCTSDHEEKEEEEEKDGEKGEEEEEDEEMDEMVVKELEDIEHHIRDILPTEIIELFSHHREFYWWIRPMKDLSEDVQKLIDSGNAISKEDVAGIKQRFLSHNCSHEENELYLDKNMDELKAMQLHIQEKLADAEDCQIGRGETMQKWLDDIRDFSRKIKAIIEYIDHLEQKYVPYRPKNLKNSLGMVCLVFLRIVIGQEAMACCGVSWNAYEMLNDKLIEEVKEILEDDTESMSMWIDFIITSTVSQGITQQVHIELLQELNTDLLHSKSRHGSIHSFDWNTPWVYLKWRFYKIRHIQSLHPVTRYVNWNLFRFTKRETVEILKQVKAMEGHIKDKLADAEKWKEARHGEGRLQDDTHVFFQQALDLLDRYRHVQPTEIHDISKLQVDLDKFQRHFSQTSIWVDACIQATGEAKLSSSGLSSRSKEAYYIIKEDTEIMSWQIHVIMLAVEQQAWEIPEETAGLLHELKEHLDQLLKSSSSFRYFDPALLFCAIIRWGLLKWKLQMTNKQIESMLRLARTLSDCSMQEMDDIIKDLKNKQHKWIKAELDDAEDEEIEGETHKKWLSELRDLSYQAEDLIGLYDYQQVANKVKPTSSLEELSIFCQQRTILPEVKEGLKDFMKKFDKIAENKRVPEWRPKNADNSSSFNIIFKHQDQEFFPEDADKFVGREEKMKELKEMLVSNHGATEVIAVVGMGGVGKTTLCQHIYNDPDITSNFHKNRWVHVGANFDLLRVANDIFTSLSVENCKTHTQYAQIQGKIKEYVHGKRLLLILDDVWTEGMQNWENIRTLFNDAGNGSKILINTRHESVAQIAGATQFLRLDKLSSEDAWLLFKMHAFHEHPTPEDLVDVGKDILAKCCGLPLAIKVVGSLLRIKGSGVDNWRSLLNSNWWNFNIHEADKENQEILGPLYLSYWHLPRHLKTCFRFISLFEKGEKIKIESLFELWVANDLISDDNGSDSIREKAHTWIKDLASRSIIDIIQETKKRFEDIIEIIFMPKTFEDNVGIQIEVHDLIHDIAQYVSGNEFCLVDGTKKGSRISLDGVRHLHVPWYLNVDDNLLDTGSDLLRTIIVEDDTHNCHQLIGRARNLRLLDSSQALFPENLCFARNLQVLNFTTYNNREMLPTVYMLYNLRQVHISCSTIVNMSCRIGNLINLRHLDLSSNYNMSKMSESVSRLTALQYLNLGGCESLQELPNGISNLKALRDLNLHSCNLKELPSGISDLSNLRALDVRFTGIQYMPCGLSRLTKLTCLPFFPLGLEEEHASLKSLKTFQQLEGKLCVQINIGCVKEEHAKEIEMSDSKKLSHLSISFDSYKQELLSDDMISEQHEQILQKLKPNVKITELEIRGYKGVKLPSWMGNRSYDKLVNLQLFGLDRCTSLSPLYMLPSLEKLDVWLMKSLIDLSEVALEENGGSSNTGSIEHPAKPEPKLYFPKLVHLSLRDCGIECLRLYDCWFPALKSLSISSCDCLKDIHFSDPTSALEQSQNEGTSSLTELYIEYCPKLCFGRDTLLPLSLKKLKVRGSNKLKRWCQSHRASKVVAYSRY